ncbi:MAG TPA: aminotransferase class IV [Pyrinomonadaceae bacterium]|jgi:branched-subunit amino acid aminotransferase/4-amino-4-deoxychorismate lyase|nr:aminotransferase class IV [Pyrinomonadaceae bacterium]
MHASIYLNEKIVLAREARVAPVSAAMLYGRGVFTTLAVYDGRPFLWPQHWQRLLDHASRTGVETGEFEEQSVGAALTELIAANRVSDGRARVTLLRRSLEDGPWKIVEDESTAAAGARLTDLIIMTGDAHVASTDSLALTVSPYRVNSHSPLAGVKSINYLDYILALEETRARGFDEAVRLNERGEVVSATMANLFWVTDGKVHTPALQTAALAGTTRASIIAIAHDLSIPLLEGVYELSDLGEAHEIFLTSSGLGLAVVTTFDFHQYTVPVGSIALRLREAFRQLTFSVDV